MMQNTRTHERTSTLLEHVATLTHGTAISTIRHGQLFGAVEIGTFNYLPCHGMKRKDFGQCCYANVGGEWMDGWVSEHNRM